ncbi:MAG: hypothetical protein PVJ57_17580 [Phycisphaerae bacterium]|jgi:hypothetical protein
MAETPVAESIQRFLGLLFEPGDVFEVRAPDCRDRPDARYTYVCCGYFTHETIGAAAQAIAELDRAAVAPAVYVTMNPVAPALLARSVNRIKPRARETTQDKDIVCRRWLLVDVDPVRPAGVSSTDVELAMAAERAGVVAAYLADSGWPAPIRVMSGNGHHLLYRVELPADDEGLVKRVLVALAERYDDADVTIDRSVHNAARIVKVAGTVSRKGDDLRGVAGLDDRPHRRAELLDVPEAIVAVPRELLERMAPPAEPASLPPPADRPMCDRLDCTPAGVRAWLEAHGVEVKGHRRNGDKTLLLLARCPINPEIASTGGSDIAVLVGDDGKLAYCNKHSRGQGYTWHDLRRALEPDWQPPADEPDVDLSAFVPDRRAVAAPKPAPSLPDPSPLPDELLRVPGFVGEVMDYCLATAPYPNPVMAFCGALALQAFLAGRRVRDAGDNRTNVYLLGLAHSAAGKDWPRKVNTRIVHEVGLAECLGDRFASGEGIQDALFLNPCMLFQTDEIDGMLQSINKAKDARHENVMGTLLTMYSSSTSVFPMRRKAGKAAPGVIDQPTLVIFGTAIPNHYYEALSERMLTNGFFARMLILESGPRCKGQEPRIADVPGRVMETARWWADFRPGRGNLQDWHPVPQVVAATEDAQALLVETREQAEIEYARAESAGDPVGTTVWGRVSEQTRKLALLHAVSADHHAPCIDVEAVRWASQFVLHQTRRMLFMASSHVADNPFHAECLKLLEKLRDAPGQELPHSVLLKRMKTDAKTFGTLVETLAQQGDIEVVTAPTPGRNMRAYRLAGAVKERSETTPGGER